jgi:hypothetical protein
MRLATLLLIPLILPSCQTTPSSDPASLSFRVPPGSTLSLNKSIDIPEGETHVVIQNGKPTAQNKKNDYVLACRLDFKGFGPRTVTPEVFKILRTEDGEGWVSRPNIYYYSTEIYLSSDKDTDVIKLVCGNWAMPPSVNFSYADIEQTLGDYFTFAFNLENPGNTK